MGGFDGGDGVEPGLFGSVAALPLEEQRVAFGFIGGAACGFDGGDLIGVIDGGPLRIELGLCRLVPWALPIKRVVIVGVQRPLCAWIVGAQYGGVVGHADTSMTVIDEASPVVVPEALRLTYTVPVLTDRIAYL